MMPSWKIMKRRAVCRIECPDVLKKNSPGTDRNLPSGSGFEPRESTWKGRKGLPSKDGTSTLSSEETVTSGCDSEDRNWSMSAFCSWRSSERKREGERACIKKKEQTKKKTKAQQTKAKKRTRMCSVGAEIRNKETDRTVPPSELPRNQSFL